MRPALRTRGASNAMSVEKRELRLPVVFDLLGGLSLPALKRPFEEVERSWRLDIVSLGAL